MYLYIINVLAICNNIKVQLFLSTQHYGNIIFFYHIPSVRDIQNVISFSNKSTNLKYYKVFELERTLLTI